MANVLTAIRILCGVLIQCFPTFSGWYYGLYLLGGFTDAIDGTVARKTGEASAFGAKFDTAADFLFTLAMAFKILRTVSFPAWLLIWIMLIAAGKIACHLVGYFRYHDFKTVHSILNKVCGGATFTVPLLIGCDYAHQIKTVAVITVCVLATVAAFAEGIAILK